MKINMKNKINPSFNMASMTDVIFLLLIFLLVTAHPTSKAIPIDLPLSKQEKTAPAAVNVSVTKTLQYYVEDQPVDFNQLAVVLRKQLERKSSKVVLLHIDKSLSIAHMVNIADVATGLGAEVSLATQFEKRP
ncbi:MAG: biopolymer transporter ExbD [Amoebophilaceae bacterium]|nr:biopolymer transporter ExbD [Amoebophilaceae bacterium]